MQREPLRPVEAAMLAGSTWRALQVGYVLLWRRGRLEHDGRGRVNRTGPAPRSAEPLERELFNALLGWQGPRQAAQRPRVEAQLRRTRRDLIARRLLRPRFRRVILPVVLVVAPAVVMARLTAAGGFDPAAGISVVLAGALAAAWFLPRRTPRGARTLRALRAEHGPLGADGTATAPTPGELGLTPEELGLAVALFGDRALHAFVPPDVLRSGLLGGGRRDITVGHQPDIGTSIDVAGLSQGGP